MENKTSLKEFIIEYLITEDKYGCGVSVVDSDFHNEIAEKFPNLKRKEYLWGCMPVPAAMRTLEKLYKEHRVRRSRTGISGGNWEPGFPKWVYTYFL